jgi:hypothetical protein
VRIIDQSHADELLARVGQSLTSGELADAQAGAAGMDVDASVAYALAEQNQSSRGRV